MIMSGEKENPGVMELYRRVGILETTMEMVVSAIETMAHRLTKVPFDGKPGSGEEYKNSYSLNIKGESK